MQESQPYLFALMYAKARAEQFRLEAERDALANSFDKSKGQLSGKFFGRSLVKLNSWFASKARTA